MPVSDPTKPWAIVLCSLEGSTGDPQVVADMQALFGKGNNSLYDYWRDQSVGVIDVSGSQLYGWYQSTWSVFAETTAGKTPYAGITSGPDRSYWHDHAVDVLKLNNPGIDVGRFRGVLSVFNFPVGGGNTGTNVVYGLNGVGGNLSWADRGWRRCSRCTMMIRGSSAGLACAVQNTPGAVETHEVGGSKEYLVASDARLERSTGGYQECQKCGGLFLGGPQGCPASGKHQPRAAGSYRVMVDWGSGLGEKGWSSCTACGLVVNSGSAHCPGTGSTHQLAPADISFCFVEYGYDRGFLCHEMGHAYGFDHGRNTRPDSWDLVGECVPGGYGDVFDIMSFDHCAWWTPKQGDPDERLGRAGPGLSAHHLNSQDLLRPGEINSISGPTAQPQTVSLRPATRRDLAGPAAVEIGNLLVEFRHHGRRSGSVFSTDGWDRKLPIGNSPGCVLVYDTGPPSPVVLAGTRGNEGLVAGERFESRLGLGGVSISVRSIDDTGEHAAVEVELTPVRVNAWNRWLVLPCQYPDLPAPTANVEAVKDVFTGGVEAFWQAMANGAAPTGGGFVVSALGSTGDMWIPLKTTWATDAKRDPATRIRASVDEALALKNPTNSKTPFYLDWRYFTGIILLRNATLGSDWSGELSLPSGNALDKLPDCPKETATGPSAGRLAYRVIEIGTDALSQAGLAAAIGHSMGLASGDQFDLMGTDPGTFRYTPTGPSGPWKVGKPAWGAIGPGLSGDNLAQLGWLRDDRTFVATVPQGQRHTTGTVTLVPLTKAEKLPGYVRLLVGPYSLEARTNDGWDSGLPEPVAVLARSFKGLEVLHQGESVTTAGALAEITGSASAMVDSLTDQAAVITYRIQEGVKIVAGGGTLHGGGTILFTSDGRVIRIPPGDPFERQARGAFDAVAALVERIAKANPLRRLEGRPDFVAGAVRLDDGRALLFTESDAIEIPGDRLDREMNTEFRQMTSLAEKIRSAAPIRQL